MKKVIYSFPFKAAAFVLCVITMLATFVCACSVIVYTSGIYNMPFMERYIGEHSEKFASDAYNMVYDIYHNTGGTNYGHYNSLNTNMRYAIVDYKGKVVLNTTGENFDEADSKWWYKIYYKVMEEDYGNSHSMYVLRLSEWENSDNVYACYGYVDTKFPIYDANALDYRLLSIIYFMLGNISAVGALGIVSAFLMIFLFVCLMTASGRRTDSQQVVQGVLKGLPFDIIVTACVISVILLCYNFIAPPWNKILRIPTMIITIIIGCCLFLGACMVLATRLKTGTFLKNNLIYFALVSISKYTKNIVKLMRVAPFILRSLSVIVVTIVVDLIIILILERDTSFFVALWMFRTVAYSAVAIYVSIMLCRLQKAGEALANGDFQHKTDTSLLVMGFKKHGENLNSVANGMAEEVENRIRSERMKTELITNVSHDIKTPLTSIINYSELIANEECENGSHKEYADVLLRKSKHLKRLLDDLLEVSKAVSGSIDVRLSRLDTGVLLNQLYGEYEEKINDKDLQLIINEPKETLYIMADERRIWRVFENLMNNACKYSLKGSRVYIDLYERGDEVIFSFKNTSATQLNIMPSELIERFVRGDGSRTSEGSGLGLSIASSFTEIQDGSFEVTIDGDLFKVDISFRKA